MNILIEKRRRRLTLFHNGRIVFSCRVALGRNPLGHKECEGDGRTPEGEYYVCTRNGKSKYYLSLGLSYPNPADAEIASRRGALTREQLYAVCSAHEMGKRPPWNTPLGGFIMIHGGGTDGDWTAGCIALENSDMKRLFDSCPLNVRVQIVP